MNLSEKEVEKYIQSQIQSAMSVDESELSQFFAKNECISIGGKKYIFDCWIENIAEGKLFVIEVTKKKYFFLKEVQSMGVLIGLDGKKIVDQSGMWDLGLG